MIIHEKLDFLTYYLINPVIIGLLKIFNIKNRIENIRLNLQIKKRKKVEMFSLKGRGL